MNTQPETAMWIKLTDAAPKYPVLDYNTLWRAAASGKIKAERRGTAWWLWEPEVELLAAKTAGLRDGAPTGASLDGVGEEWTSLRSALDAYTRALIQVEVCDRGLVADELEARAAGNTELAAAIAEARAHLRAARVFWNGSSWTLQVPGVGSANSRPVAPAKAEA